jgi:hypothetical protein
LRYIKKSVNNYEEAIKGKSLEEILGRLYKTLDDISKLLDKRETYEESYLVGPKTEYRNEYNPFERKSNNMY